MANPQISQWASVRLLSPTFPQAPLFIPDSRISRVGLATIAFLKQPSQYSGNLSAGSHTPLTLVVYCLARADNFVSQLIQVLRPGLVSFQHRHVPRAPLPKTGCYLLLARYPVLCQMALPILHRSYGLMCQTQLPPAAFDLTITTGLCRLSPVPAGRWSFPTLSLQVFPQPGAWTPIPVGSYGAFARFFP